MTLLQLALASRSSVTWLSNSSRILKRRLHRTPSGARWWGLVRILSSELGLPLAAAAQTADATLRESSPATAHHVTFPTSVDQSVALTIDLERFQSTCNGALAAALIFAPPKKRGRPRQSFASAKPPHQLSEIWTIRVEAVPEALERLAHHLKQWNAYPRGIDTGLPFIMDATTLRAIPRMALTSDKGPIDVLVEPAHVRVSSPAIDR